MTVYIGPPPEDLIRMLLDVPWRPRDGTLQIVTPVRMVRGGLVQYRTEDGSFHHVLPKDFHERYEPLDPGRHTSPWDWIVED